MLVDEEEEVTEEVVMEEGGALDVEDEEVTIGEVEEETELEETDVVGTVVEWEVEDIA